MAVNPLKGKTLEQIAQMAAAKGASQSQIQAGYNAVSGMKQSQPVKAPTSMPVNAPAPIQAPQSTPMATPTVANPFSSGEDGDIAMAGRKAPTVATPSNPVVNTQVVSNLAYDPNDPEDFLLRTQAKAQSGGKLSEQEYYDALRAQKALQSMQINTDPFGGRMEEFTAEQTRLREEERARDTSELGAFRTALEAQYGVRKDELLQSANRQKDAAQGVLSFSGFGRSTAAADTMVQIQKDADNAINAMNAAMQAEIARKEAELAGADGEALQALDEQIAQYRAAATEWQIGAIKATQEANQAAGTSYMEAINNLMTAASGSGIELGDAKNIQEMATLARNADGSINEEFVSSLPEDIQAVIRSAAMTSQGGTGEAAKVINTGTAKSPRYMQRNPQTNRYDIPVGSMAGTGGGGGFGGGGGSGGMGGGGTSATGEAAPDMVVRLKRIKEAMNNNPIQTKIQIATGVGQVGSDFNNVLNNLTFTKLAEMKKKGFTGTLTDADMKLLKKSATSLNWSLGGEAFAQEVNRLVEDVLGYKASTTPNTQSGNGTTTPTSTAPTTIDDLR